MLSVGTRMSKGSRLIDSIEVDAADLDDNVTIVAGHQRTMVLDAGRAAKLYDARQTA